jgi:hypothetical protein
VVACGQGRRTRFEFSALSEYAVELSGVTTRAPRVCFVATAIGGDAALRHHLWEAAHLRGWRPSELTLFPMPNVDDIEALLLGQDRLGGRRRDDRRLGGLVPYSNGVHYDSEAQGRPLFQRLIADRTLPPGYATDDGAGLSTAARETRLDVRRL